MPVLERHALQNLFVPTATEQALGEPQRREGNRLIYDCSSSEVNEPVVFEISEGTVQRIVFNYYVD